MPIGYISPVAVGRRAGATAFPDDALYSALEEIVMPINAAGVRASDLSKVVCIPGGRTGEKLRAPDLLFFAASLIEGLKPQSTPGKPELNTVFETAKIAATAAKKSPAETLLHVQCALLDASAKYLFACPDHGGLRCTSDLVIFPLCDDDLEEEEDEGTVEGAGPDSLLGSVVGVGSKRAREDDDVSSMGLLQQAIAAEELARVPTPETQGAAPAKKRSLVTDISIETQIKARMATLNSLLQHMEHVKDYSVPIQEMIHQTCRGEVAEALRLCRLEPDIYAEEVKNMVYLQEGLKKSLNTHQVVMGVLWLRGRLLETCQDGTSVDFKRMDEEFSTLKKVVGLGKHDPQRGAGLQPVALTPAFQGAAYGGPVGMPHMSGFAPPSFQPPQPPFEPPAFNSHGYGGPPGGFHKGGSGLFGAPGHYGRGGGGRGRGRGGGRGGGRGQGFGGEPLCRKCQNNGRSDFRHPHTVCPFTLCFNCRKPGHTKYNCTSPPAP